VRLDIVAAVFRKELRELLRDRRSLAVMVGIPLLLYPLVAIGVASLGSSKMKEQRERPARVAIANAHAAPKLAELLAAEKSGIQRVTPGDVEAALRSGEADAAVEIPAGAEQWALAGEESPRITVRLDRSRTPAAFAERKIDAVLDRYERWVIEQRLSRRGVPPSVLAKVRHEAVDIARGDQRFGKVLSQMLPLLLLMTGMLGALFPALNATTTERELGTLETLLVTPAGRTELLFAKGALVLVCGLLTAGLNMLSMSLVLKRSLSMLDDQELVRNLSISPSALLLTFLAAVPALMFFTTIVLILGLLARNFREANAFATPVMLLPLTSLAVGIIEPAATPGILVTPVANTTVIIRDVLTGRATFGAFALAFASSLVYAGLMLSVAARLFSNEQLVNPAWEPLSVKGLRRRGSGERPRRMPAVDEVLALCVVSLLLLFYVSPEWTQKGLMATLLGNELLLILAPALLLAWFGRWKWRETFSWRRAAPTALAGAALLGIGLSPWVQFIAMLQNKLWPGDLEQSRMVTRMVAASLQQHLLLTIVGIGLLAGVCEELFYRGPLQAALMRKVNPWVAIGIAGFLFGAAHMDLHGLPVRTMLGVLFGWLVWRGGSIFPAMLAHALFDSTTVAMLAYGLRQAGIERVAASPAGAIQLERFDVIALAAGAVLTAAGFTLCRKAFRRRGAAAPISTSPLQTQN
jgi:sodium transport system permease protein